MVAVWKTVIGGTGEPLRAWARLDSGEYASAPWTTGGPEAGWRELIAELSELSFVAGAADLGALTLGTQNEAPAWERGLAVAFIAEDVEAHLPNGRYEVHLATIEGKHVEGPADTDFDTAVAWARERAEVIQFRPEGTDHHYSLGRRGVPETPEWPEGIVVRRRPERTPLDGSVTERPWPVRVGFGDPVDVVAPSGAEAVERMVATLGPDTVSDVSYSSTDE